MTTQLWHLRLLGLAPGALLEGSNVDNLMVLCRPHHDQVERKELDLGDFVTNSELSHATMMIGCSRASKILYPSSYRLIDGEGKAA